jgi:hypothetical protein
LVEREAATVDANDRYARSERITGDDNATYADNHRRRSQYPEEDQNLSDSER